MKKKFLFLPFALLCSVLIFVHYFIIDIRRVSGHSMEPTLVDGQYVVILKIAYGLYLPFKKRYAIRWLQPESGDIVCYMMHGRNVIKHCVKTGGAMLHFSRPSKILGSYAELHLDGINIPLTAEHYYHLGGSLPAAQQKVPKSFILALGDNLAESYDSRDYGFVSIDSIYGKLLWK